MMKFTSIFAATAAIFISVSVSAQSAAEIAAARSMAKAYGYSDSEIESFMNHKSSQSRTEGETAREPVNMKYVPEVMQVGYTVGKERSVKDFGKDDIINDRDAKKDKDQDSDKLEIYGQSYFKSDGLSMLPTYNAPAPASYVLGPGDEVTVDIWGSTVSHVVATIANDGSITLKDFGPVYLAGMTLKAAESSLKNQLSSIYSGLSDNKDETFLRLSIGKIKGVSVSVSGEVETPGVYVLPSLSTIPSAIFMAGGIRPLGSVRNIALFRKGRKVAAFDLYDFLFNGKFNDNLRLQDGDLISVEAYSNVVSVNGAVMEPMRYEMKEGESLQDLINYARGFNTHAQRNEIHVTRVDEISRRDFDVRSEDFGSFALLDGDNVSVRFYYSDSQNSVSVSGPVKYPGNYAIGDGIDDVASLVNAAGGLLEGAYAGKGQINRIDENKKATFITFDLGEVLRNKTRIELKRRDEVVLFRNSDFSGGLVVSIMGAVNNPGVYSYKSNMKVSELIELAGGVSVDAYQSRGQISRNNTTDDVAIAPFSIKDAEKIKLFSGDAVRIYSIEEIKQNATVSVLGEVNAPGVYTFRNGITIGDVVGLAQGFKDGADLTNVEIAGKGGRERGTVRTVNLEDNPENMNIKLSPYDIVSFRRLTYFREQTAITVTGEVMSPGSYIIEKPEARLSDVIAKVGGFTDDAYLHGASLTRTLTEDEIERQELGLDISKKNLGKKAVIDTLFLSGKVSIGIDLEEALSNPGSVSDVILRTGDVLDVPQMNNTVKISGGVFYPNIVTFDKKLSWRQYVRLSGGFSKRAIKRKTYALYMNGKVAVGNEIKPEPGMEIVVPQRDVTGEQRVTPAELASLATVITSVTSLIVTMAR